MAPADAPSGVAPPPLRIVLADDHRMVLSALRHLLSDRVDYRIVAEAQDAAQLLELPELALADVVLLDLNLPVPAGEVRSAELPGLKVLPRLRQLTPAKILVLSMHDESAVVLRALHLGASGFVTKSSPGERLFDAIDAVCRGGTYLDPALLGVEAQPAAVRLPVVVKGAGSAPGGGESLSRQEREVGTLLLAGLSQKAISHRLGISPQSTHTYKRRLKEKLGVRTDVELLRQLPQALGLHEPPEPPPAA